VQWHNRIVEYAKAQAYSMDGNIAMHDRHMEMFRGNAHEMRANAGWENTEFYPHITASADDSEDGYDSVVY
jgi:hypothetical protein